MRWVNASLLASGLFVASTAHADPASVDLRTYRSPLSHEAPLTLEPAAAQDGLLNASLRINYAFQPVVLRRLVGGDAGREPGPVDYAIVEHQVTADLGFGIGITSWLTLGAELPFVMAQTGDEHRADPQAVARIGDDALPITALSDPALSAKFTFYEVGFGARPFAIGSRHRVSFPLGDERSLDAEGAFTLDNALLIDFRAFIPVRFHANVDHFFRFDEGVYGCGDDLASCDTRFRHSIGVGIGAILEIEEVNRHGIFPFVETRTVLPVAPVSAGDLGPYVFSSAGSRFTVGDVALIGGVEWSYVGELGAPPIRATVGLSYEPSSRDRDKDGVNDANDYCPSLKETPDGRLDDDGCPEMPDVECNPPCDAKEVLSPPPPTPPPG